VSLSDWVWLFLAAWLAGALATSGAFIFALNLVTRQHRDQLATLVKQHSEELNLALVQLDRQAAVLADTQRDANERIAAVRADRDTLVLQLRADRDAAVALARGDLMRWEHTALEAFNAMSQNARATLTLGAVVDKQAQVVQAVAAALPPDSTTGTTP
jgi:hypothetical protein